jgi:phosphoesterase RecJ-like protein
LQLTQNTVDQIQNLIMNSKQIAIISHANPDGDAIGSVLGLHLVIKKLHKESLAIVPNDFPKFLQWICCSEEIIRYENDSKRAKEYLMTADCIFCLDFNSLDRIGEDMKTILNKSGATKVLVDHHLEPESFADVVYSTTETSSTSEMVFDFLTLSQLKKNISKEAAEALYVGIMTDTGSFKYACNNPKTFKIAAELVEIGIDPEKIHQKVYDTNSENRLRLLGFSISEKLVVLNEYNTAYIYLSKKDLQKFKFKSGDTEGVVNYALSIENINFAAIFIEKKNVVRISFRSKGKFSVNTFARKYYDGGGHQNAAGGNSYISLKNTIKKFEELLPSHKNEIKNSLV